jgi:hypothetical protein
LHLGPERQPGACKDAATAAAQGRVSIPSDKETLMTDAVTQLLAAIESGVPVPAQTLAGDVVLDATLPDWRMTVRGSEAVRSQFARWYADTGRFERVVRTPVTGGEIVRFDLSWEELGVPHAVHQAHFLELDDAGLIRHDEMFCGGRWDAGLLAEMEEADRVGA